MSHSETHIIYLFISNSKSLFTDGRSEEYVYDEFDRHVLQTRFVDFGRHLGDENPNENIEETYLCGQKWPIHGTSRESK